MHLGRIERVLVVELEGDDVLGLRLVEPDALSLDVDRAATGRAGTDVAERQVGIALEREDPAGTRDLLAKRLRSCDHYRRSVGG